MTHITLLGAPVQCGAPRRPGCLMGPDALRTAGLPDRLTALGHDVADRGNLTSTPLDVPPTPGAALSLRECAGWIDTLQRAAAAIPKATVPIFLGGDHLMSAGTVPGLAARADRPLFVLWLDAHPDLHDLTSTTSGNLHGTPMAHALGLSDFAPHYPAPLATVAPERVCMIGLRSVDARERAILAGAGIRAHDMRAIDERGIRAPLIEFLDEVRAADGTLHVSLDVDFLEPAIAPAVGTTVPGGATFREAHLVMEELHDSGLVTSLDLAELNPALDERGRTATLVTDLVASLFGASILDRPNRSA
ncbi:MAG: arginase [Paracoccaceae bacterium]